MTLVKTDLSVAEHYADVLVRPELRQILPVIQARSLCSTAILSSDARSMSATPTWHRNTISRSRCSSGCAPAPASPTRNYVGPSC
jgi:hypothetical protein